MDHLHLLCIFIISTTTLFTDISPTGGFLNSWFDAQHYCLGQGLTIERDKSDQPYWTGVYRRLTPWINILGCFSDSIESLTDIVNKTMAISSVGMCQEMCYHKNVSQFAVKMNMCLCIERDIRLSHFTRLSPTACNYKCDDNSDDIYSGDCGGESAYNIYETQEVLFNSIERCLILQCATDDIRFLPKKCSESFEKVCENMKLPDNGYASSWTLSMEQCRESQLSSYLLGDIILNNPRLVCNRMSPEFKVVWVGVARQMYTSIDQGWEMKEELRETFLECQMCERNVCQFRRCSDLLASSIFCKNTSARFQGKTTSTLMSNHSTSDVIFASTSTTGNDDQDILPSTNDRFQKSGTSENIVLKISLPIIVGFITLFLCVLGVVLYKRRGRITKTDRTTKAEVKFVHQKHIYSELEVAHINSSFALEHCYQKISKVRNSLNESPYSRHEGMNDYLRDKQAGKTEENTIYQNPSIDITGDTSGYDIIAYNKHQEKEATYDHLGQYAKET